MMKRIILLLTMFLAAAGEVSAQNKRDTVVKEEVPPYLKYPTLPAFNILLTDSSTLFNAYNIPKGRPIVLMLFDPECSHCKKMAKEMTERMDSLQNLRFYLFTSAQSMQAVRKFAEEFHFSKYPNIEVVGRDPEFFFISFYRVRSVPGLAIYDGKKNLVTLIDNKVTVDELLKYTRDLK